MAAKTFFCLFFAFFCLGSVISTVNEDPIKYICKDVPCKNGGTCNIAKTMCKCEGPFTGPMCEIDPCIPNPCKNNHTCEHSEENFRCNCRQMYRGNCCEKVLDLCYGGDRCMNGGTCRVEDEDFKCDCIRPYTGTSCEQELTTRPETSSISLTTNMTSTTSNEHNSSVLTNTIVTTIKPMPRNATISPRLLTNSTQPINPADFNITETADLSSIVPESSAITKTIYLASSEEPPTKIAQPVTTTVKLTTRPDFESTTIDSNISTSEESSSISELKVATSNEEKSSSTESASSKTTTVNSINTTDPEYVSSTKTDDPSTTVLESSTIIMSISSSEEESSTITKVAQLATTVKSTNLTEFELTTVNPNISILTSAESSTISESTLLTSNEEKSPTTESASSKTTTVNSISTTDPAYVTSRKTDDPSIMVSESSAITISSYRTSSKEESTTTKIAQPVTTTVKLTKPADFVLTTVDPSISISTLKELSKITKSTVLTSNEREIPSTKSASSTIYLVSSTDSVSFEKSTKNVLPRIVSSKTEILSKITTESAISASTDDTVTKIEVEAKKRSSKTVAYICGATGGGFGLILLIISITYYLRRVKTRKQLPHLKRDDSSSVGSADSTSRLA